MSWADYPTSRTPRTRYRIQLQPINHIHAIPSSTSPPPPRLRPLSQNRLKELSLPKHGIPLPEFMPPHNVWESSLRKRFFSSPATLRGPLPSHKPLRVELPRLTQANYAPEINAIASKSVSSIPISRRVGQPNMVCGRTSLELSFTPRPKLNSKVECTCGGSNRGLHECDKFFLGTFSANEGLLVPFSDPHSNKHLKCEAPRLRKPSFTIGHHSDHIKSVAIDIIEHSFRSCVRRIFARIEIDLHRRVVLIQNTYRCHRLRLLAGVELNLLKLRRDEESQYWAEVALKWEQKVQRDIQGTVLPPEGPGEPAFYHSLSSLPSFNQATCQHHSMSYDMNVYNYSTAGPFPELLLRKELETAILTNLRRSITSNLMASSYTFLHSEVQERNDSRIVSSEMPLASSTFRKHLFWLPIFLPHEIFVAIMDNMCFIVGELRGDPSLFAHLKGRGRSIVEY